MHLLISALHLTAATTICNAIYPSPSRAPQGSSTKIMIAEAADRGGPAAGDAPRFKDFGNGDIYETDRGQADHVLRMTTLCNRPAGHAVSR